MHEKYEISSMSTEAQWQRNLKATELLVNESKGMSVLNFNAGFFGGTS